MSQSPSSYPLSFVIIERKMTCPYEANPFAGVICKICQYPIRMKHNLFVDIHLHERRNRNHFIASSPDQRKLFSAALQQQIADVVCQYPK